MELLHLEAIPPACEVARGHAYVWMGEKIMTRFYVITQPIAWRHQDTCKVFPFPHIFWSNQIGYGHCTLKCAVLIADRPNDLVTHRSLILLCRINNNGRRDKALWFRSNFLLSLHYELTLSAEYSLNIYCISYGELSEMEIDFHQSKESLYAGLFIAWSHALQEKGRKASLW